MLEVMTYRFVLRRLVSVAAAGVIGLGAWAALPGTASATPAPLAPAPSTPVDMGLFPAMQAAGSVLGHPYRWGGSSPGGFDCSGLTTYAWAGAGVDLYRQSGSQISQSTRLSKDEAKAGDLVHYSGHVMLYLGVDDAIVHSVQTGRTVEIDTIRRGSVTFGDPSV